MKNILIFNTRHAFSLTKNNLKNIMANYSGLYNFTWSLCLYCIVLIAVIIITLFFMSRQPILNRNNNKKRGRFKEKKKRKSKQ